METSLRAVALLAVLASAAVWFFLGSPLPCANACAGGPRP